MNSKIIKIKQVVEYGGHSINSKGLVNFTLKASYNEIVETINLIQLLNNDVSIKARMPGRKPIRLGYFRIKSIMINGDGCSVLKFNGIAEQIEVDNLNVLPMVESETDELVVLMEAEVELEQPEEETEIDNDGEYDEIETGEI